MAPGSLIECCTPLVHSELSADDTIELEQLFKALADRNRVRILNLLASTNGEAVCVCALTPALGLAQATVSYHLKLLVQAGLLEREERGRFSFYLLVPGALDRVGRLLASPRTEAKAA